MLRLKLARFTYGGVEEAEWIRVGDSVCIVTEGQETVIGPEAWKQAWADLEARGFIEVSPNFQPRMIEEKKRVLKLIRSAFRGVTLGEGIGLREANGLDDYADTETLAAYRAQDEKNNWSAISFEDLGRYHWSLSYFDAAGMRFHLPAYLVADLVEGGLTGGDIVFRLVSFENLGTKRYEMLTASQHNAVREFLLLRLSDADYEFYHPEIEAALRGYWTAQ